jgi:hypothetical protein
MGQHYCAVTSTRTAAELVALVKANCGGHQAVRPMTAWAGPVTDGIGTAEVLGWARGSQIHLPRLDEIVAQRVADARRAVGLDATGPAAGVDTRALLGLFTQDYVVLRAPWLWYAGASGALPGLVPLLGSAAWAALHPDPADDAFALDGGSLKEYFRGIAVAS